MIWGSPILGNLNILMFSTQLAILWPKNIKKHDLVMDSPGITPVLPQIFIAKATAFPMVGLASEFGSEAANDGHL
jgi:uncharacterized membrane protein YjjB (DUF3815 family)